MSALLELKTDIKGRTDKVAALFDEIDAKQGGVATPEQIESIKSLNKEIEEREISLKSLEEQDALRSANTGRQNWLATIDPASRPPFATGGDPESRGDQRALFAKSYGERFLEHPAIKAWFDAVAPGGNIPMVRHGQGAKVESPRIYLENQGFKALIRSLPQVDGDAYKALVTGSGATSGAPFVNIDYQGLLDPEGTFQRPLRIRDLVRVIQTNSDTVEYPRIGTHTNAAAPVAEATAQSGSSGVKPESTLVTATVTETVKTIAHWIPATRRALADAPMLRDLINAFLRYGLAEELEDQMVSGAGTGENFTGVLNTSGIQTQAYSASLLTTTRKARTLCVLNGRATPNAWVMHPNDWEDFDLLTDNETRYYFGGPMSLGTPRLWGVPVIESEAITEGTALLGDWRWAVLFDRMQTAIYVSDSHGDLFIRNMIAILAELRAAFGVIRPKAFVSTDLTA